MQITKTLNHLLFLFLACLGPLGTRAQQARWQQKLNYDISVTLNDADHSLDGFLTLDYTNQSPDTLQFIWFHLWPNAYKTDRTAFSDQLLENGKTDFYFSNADKRGYINRLDFRVGNQRAETRDHPNHIDIVQVILPKALTPGATIRITTPFHVKLPYTYSRSGFDGKAYQITQWYPKPAVYDRQGWHPMPYLDQGEFYAEFGSYDVKITLPADYVVAATGICVNEEEAITSVSRQPSSPIQYPTSTTHQPSSKTLVYKQDRVHDFAWFADKRFRVSKDSLQLTDGRTVQTRVYSLQKNERKSDPKKKGKTDPWTNAQAYLKKAIRFHSINTGAYPHEIVSVVEGKQGFEGGMEYPTITILHGADAESLEELIVHEVGHNWFQGILGTNERQSPWMDEGLNSYYDERYRKDMMADGGWWMADSPAKKKTQSRTTPNIQVPTLNTQPSTLNLLWKTLASIHQDQPIRTPADRFNTLNYVGVAYGKTADWFFEMEKLLGPERFDSTIRTYYQQYQFSHPQEEDLLNLLKEAGGSDATALIAKLDQTGSIIPVERKGLKVKAFGSLDQTDKTHNLYFTPLPGYNMFDGPMLGLMLHNYTLPLPRFRYAVAPMYAFRSKQVNGIANLNYRFYPAGQLQEIRIMLDAATFSMDDFDPDNAPRISQRFTKLSPGLRLEWKNQNPRETVIKSILYKYFLIGEDELRFQRDTVIGEDIVGTERTNYQVHQLTLGWENYRVLYPWKAELRGELGDGFGRVSFTGNYFFNFRKRGGVAVRFFAGKFFYTSEQTTDKVFETDRFHLNMSGPRGYEDYTYSNYFVGRNAFEGFPSQQMMIRDGAFKVATDLLSQKVGKTDDWLMAANLVLDVPDRFNILNALPGKIPLKIFADVGTFAEAWDEDNGGSRLLFDAGLQLSFLKNTVNLYIPLVYSKVYRDYFQSTPGNGFFQRISFSVDLHLLNIRNQLMAGLK
jgi:hypothetical protein